MATEEKVISKLLSCWKLVIVCAYRPFPSVDIRWVDDKLICFYPPTSLDLVMIYEETL